MDEDIVIVLVSGLIVLVMAGGITLRFTLKPIVEAVARLMEARTAAESANLLARRVEVVEHELEGLRADVQRIAEKQDFADRLSKPDES